MKEKTQRGAASLQINTAFFLWPKIKMTGVKPSSDLFLLLDKRPRHDLTPLKSESATDAGSGGYNVNCGGDRRDFHGYV